MEICEDCTKVIYNGTVCDKCREKREKAETKEVEE